MFSELEKLEILSLKTSIASYYNLQMKKISNAHLESLFFNACVISGGCISSLYHNEKVYDIDLYPKTTKDLVEIKDYIINLNKNIKTFTNYDENALGDQLPAITDNAVTLTNDVQFVYMNTWEECKKTFDYVHCSPHYDLATQKLHISKSQYDAIKSKTLVELRKAKALRYDKYVKRGWTINSKSGDIK